VVYHDPYVLEFEAHGLRAQGVELTDEVLQESDLVIITTDHKNVDYARVVALAPLILDTRYATRGFQSEKVILL